jgi:DNA (cytosine-5)-methyltransferase 1
LPTHSIPTPTAQDHIERRSTSTETLNFATNKSVSLDRFAKMWPTPHGFSQDGRSNGPSGNELGRAVNQSMWPTPRAEYDSGKHNGKPDTLHSAVKMWPTPTTDDANQGENARKSGTISSLSRAAKYGYVNALPDNYDMTTAPTGSLNPTWVEWLMGFPLGWTALDPLATRSSRKSRKSSGEPS